MKKEEKDKKDDKDKKIDTPNKHNKPKNYIVSRCILSIVLVCVICAIAYVAVAVPDDEPLFTTDEQQSSTQEESSETESSAEESSEEATDEISDTTSEEDDGTESSVDETTETISLNLDQTPSSNSSDMKAYIEDYGLSFDTLLCSQFIIVDTEGSSAKVYCFQKSEDGYWFNIIEEGTAIEDTAYVSSSGLSFDATDENECTPMGMYPLEEIFYIGEVPNTSYSNLLEITDTTYWVTDPDSEFYNQAADETDKDWTQAIKLSEDPDTYSCGVVIGYNTSDIDTAKASAIFMMCGDEPTDGGVAVSETAMRTIAEWLENSGSAYILII